MDTYNVRCNCTNCGHNGIVAIKKGEKRPSVVECPNCGCNTAETSIDIWPCVRVPKKPWKTNPWTIKLQNLPRSLIT